MTRHLHGAGAALLLLASVGLAWYGQPSPVEKWAFLAPELEPRLVQRQVQIDPAELAELMHNDYIDLNIIDVRNERDWNLFHLWGAQRMTLGELLEHRQRFTEVPENGVIVFVSNDETLATEAWKLVMANSSQPNAYILAGGINRWLDKFAASKDYAEQQGDHIALADETLRRDFAWALGSRHPASLPQHPAHDASAYTAKVKLQKRNIKKGGCG